MAQIVAKLAQPNPISPSVTSLPSTTHDDLPDLSLDSDLSTSLLDDTSTSLDLTLNDLDEILA